MSKKPCKIFHFSTLPVKAGLDLLQSLNDNLGPSESVKRKIHEKGKGTFYYLTKHDQDDLHMFCLNRCRVNNWPNFVDIETLLESPIEDIEDKGILEKAYFAIDNNGNMVALHNYHVCSTLEFPKKISKILKNKWDFKLILPTRDIHDKIESFSITVEGVENSSSASKKISDPLKRMASFFKNDPAENLNRLIESKGPPRGTNEIEKNLSLKFTGGNVEYGEIKQWLDDNYNQMRISQALIWIKGPRETKNIKIDLLKGKRADIDIQMDTNHGKYLEVTDVAKHLKSCLAQ